MSGMFLETQCTCFKHQSNLITETIGFAENNNTQQFSTQLQRPQYH